MTSNHAHKKVSVPAPVALSGEEHMMPSIQTKKGETLRSLWFVYIILCSDKTFYTGIATNVTRRFDEHSGVGKKGARYTSTRRPLELVFSACVGTSRSVALKIEHKVKKLSKDKKQAMVTSGVLPEFDITEVRALVRKKRSLRKRQRHD